MIDSDKRDRRIADAAAQAEGSERPPWIAPRIETYAVGDTESLYTSGGRIDAVHSVS